MAMNRKLMESYVGKKIYCKKDFVTILGICEKRHFYEIYGLTEIGFDDGLPIINMLFDDGSPIIITPIMFLEYFELKTLPEMRQEKIKSLLS